MVSLQFGARLSGPLLGFMNRDAEPRPCSLFWQRCQKNKSIFHFSSEKEEEEKINREREQERRREGGRRTWGGEKNSSTSAPALLVPYARLRGRKYPQFNVIRAGAAQPIAAALVELIGQQLRSGPYRLNVPHILTPPPKKYMFHFHTERSNHSK